MPNALLAYLSTCLLATYLLAYLFTPSLSTCILVSMSTLPSSIAIVGLGLMGGSLALALKEKNAPPKIIGITRTRATLDAALERGAIDVASDQLDAARDAELVVLAAPVRTILKQIPQLATIARDGALVIDMGSTKRAIVDAMNRLPERLSAVGGHPMCGKEVAGFEHAEANLYQNKIFVLAKTERTTPAALDMARALARTIGSRIVELDAARHDEIVASVSHLPYIVAANLVNTVSAFAQEDAQVWNIAASGFRDTSRLAASDVQMMLDILLTNGENVAALMRQYARLFGALADAVYDADEKTLRELLGRAASKRQEWQKLS
ncbi:MAG: prephenate dehydrogenase [Chloroflexi bacterium]|nr:prephenate dehydrogenase [Chloroflexota bacterium]